ncbi:MULTISPECIES: hypothetical protein [Nonomuraea]|uniref:Uncharacterized protein n=1 Tax=Nonomuraea mangrovi TaxID=2316207 RepID=A0ABW4SQE3_9ACTN
MTRAFDARHVAFGLAALTVAVFGTQRAWSVSLEPLAWTLLGVTAGYSLSGSV